MEGILHTDRVLIDDVSYVVRDGVVLKRRVFPELPAVERTNVDFPIFQEDDRRQQPSGEPISGQLHPIKRYMTIDDFANGSGLYVDHGRKFSRRAYKSTLNHSNEGLLVLMNRRQQVTLLSDTVNGFIHYRNNVYLLTEIGLYVWTEATNTIALVTGSPVQSMVHATIHRQFLVIACGAANAIQWYDGTTWTTDPSAKTATRLADLKERLFAAEPRNANGVIPVSVTSTEGATWVAFTGPDANPIGLPAPSDATNICVAPSGDGVPRVHIATPTGVWLMDDDTFEYALLHDMSHDMHEHNGKVLLFWPSTRKLYVSERSTIVEINPQSGEARPIGPDFQAGPPPSIPNGFPSDFRPSGITCGTTDPNFLYIGTDPTNTLNYSLIMKMDVEGHWYFETRGYDGGAMVRAMLKGGPSDPGKLYFTDDHATLDDSYVRYLEYDGDYAEEGEIETPWLTFGFPDIEKCIYSIQVEGDQLSTTELIALRYRKDYDEAVDYALSDITSADSRPYIRNIGTAPDLGTDCQSFKLIIKLDRNDATPTVTPRVFRVVITYRLMPPPLYEYEMELLFGEDGDDPNWPYTDKITTLVTLMEGSCSFGLIVTGDPSDTEVAVVPKGDQALMDFDQLRETRKQRLVLIEIAPSAPTTAVCHVHTLDTFTGDASEVDFTLLHAPNGELITFLDDLYQIEGSGFDYTRTGQQLTFAAAPGLNAIIRVHYNYLA